MTGTRENRRTRRFAFGRGGFTLVEVLVSLLITLLLLGATFSIYLAAQRSWETSRRRSDVYQYARVALSRIERYLRSAVPPDSDRNIAFEGEDGTLDELVEGLEETASTDADTLAFASTGETIVPGEASQVDYCEVEFFLNDDPDMPELGLMMRRKTPRDLAVDEVEESDEGEVDELAPRCASFNVSYHDGTDWVDEWMGQEELPAAVEVSLVFAIEESGKTSYENFVRRIALDGSGALGAAARAYDEDDEFVDDEATSDTQGYW